MKSFLEILNDKAKEAGKRIKLMSYEPELVEQASKEYESQFRQAAVTPALPDGWIDDFISHRHSNYTDKTEIWVNKEKLKELYTDFYQAMRAASGNAG